MPIIGSLAAWDLLLRSVRNILPAMKQTIPVRMLARAPMLTELPSEALGATMGLRLWALMARMRSCAMAALAERFGSMRAAAHFHLLIEEVMTAWPDAFCISPPCSPRLSHDEATLADMVVLASRGDRPGFDRLLAELLPAAERERLFLSAGLVGKALARG